jgi:esterase/lipase
MKKIIYIIPGLGEHCGLLRYKKLKNKLSEKGYRVNCINPDWYRPLSEQIFSVEKEAIIFGFSFGAILAYLITKKQICRKIIFGSISPIHEFSFKSLVDDYSEHMPKCLAEEISMDIKKIEIVFKEIKTPFVTIAGDLEKMKADIRVPLTGHRINKKYIESIIDLV